MRRPVRPWVRRHRRLLGIVTAAALALLASAAGPASLATADTSPGPSVLPACPPEQYPHGGAPRASASTLYEIPFTATLGQPATNPTRGGYLQIANSLVTATLGGPVMTSSTGQKYGSIYAVGCGQFQLPSETGNIPGNPYGSGGDPNFNNNFIYNQNQKIAVSLSVTGIPLALPAISSYGAADGDLTAAISHTPAANGGMNVTFTGGSKATSDFGPALSNIETALAGLTPAQIGALPAPVQSVVNTVQNLLNGVTGGVTSTAGAACTIPIGNLLNQGVPAAEVDQGASGPTGLTVAQATTDVTLTTQTSGLLTGTPIVGPITSADATLVDNDFPVAAIVPDTNPAPSDPGATCTSANANLLNTLLGLPSIPDPATGKYPNTFYAPSTFAIFTSS